MGLDLVMIETPTPDIKTLATDGYHILYSPDFIAQLSIDEIEFTIAHEIYHCIFCHTNGEGKAQRKCDDWDSKIWNRACDYVINYDLVDSKIGTTTVIDKNHHVGPIQICYDEKYKDMSAEQVYFDLIENGDPSGGELLDVHIEFNIIPDGEGSGSPSVEKMDGGIKITMTASEYAAEAARWQEIGELAMANVANSSQGAGSVPAHLARMIGNLVKPVIKWPVLLRKFVTKIRSTGYNWTVPSKNTYGSAIIPSFRTNDNNLTIAVAIDTSGSVGNEALDKFVSELLGILKSYRSYTIHAFCFEGDVDESTYMEIKSFDGDPKKNLMSYASKISGGGGTNFHTVWKFMKRKKIRPRGLVFFTDGYPCDSSWKQESKYCPTMFITVGNQNNWKAPFGATIEYESQ